jgi:hypothetical protein
LKQLQRKEAQVEANKNKATAPIATPTTPTALYLSGVKVGKCIGEGNFGKVFIGEWSKIEVALKSFKQALEEDEKEISTFQ